VRRQLRHLLADLDATASIRPGQYLISVRMPRADQRPDGDRLAHDLHLVMAKLGALEGDPNSGALITQERVQGTNG
jgi:hypothetical protein